MVKGKLPHSANKDKAPDGVCLLMIFPFLLSTPPPQLWRRTRRRKMRKGLAEEKEGVPEVGGIDDWSRIGLILPYDGNRFAGLDPLNMLGGM